MRKKKSDNRGASLVVVIITIAFIGILVSMIMYMSLLNFQIKAADLKNKNSFYSAETALDEIKVGLQGEVSEAMGSAYLDIMQNYSLYTDTGRNEQFAWQYMNALRDELKMPGTEDKYQVAKLTSYLQETAWDEATQTGAKITAEDADKGVLLVLNDGVVLKDVTVTYVGGDGNVSKIKTDIKLSLPEVAFNESFKLPDILSYCLIANNRLRVNTGASEIVGSVYGGRNGMIVENSAIQMHGADLIVTDGLVTLNNASFIVGEDSNLWVDGIEVNSSTAEFLGSAYVQDDLTIDGVNSTVKISNTYYGYGYGGSGESASNAGGAGAGEQASIEESAVETGAVEVGSIETVSLEEGSKIVETAIELDEKFGFFKNKDGSITVYVQDFTQTHGQDSDRNYNDDINDNVTPMLHLEVFDETMQTAPGLSQLDFLTTLKPDSTLGENYYSCVIPPATDEQVIYFHYTYYPVDTKLRTDSGVLGTVVGTIDAVEEEVPVVPDVPEIVEPDVKDKVDETADNNSAILINGIDTTLDMSGVQRLYLAGQGYINTAGRVTMDGVVRENESVLMGESLAVKSDQLAYLVPTECLWVLDGNSLCNTNPVPADKIAEYQTAGAREVSLGTVSRTLDAPLGNYAQGYQKVYRVVGDVKLVYYYLTFDTEEAANKFFKAYYAADKERMDSYLKVYVKSLKLPVDSMLRINLAGNVFSMENGKFVLNNATAATDDNAGLKLESDSYANTFFQLCTSLSRVNPTTAQKNEKEANGIFYNVVDREELNKLVPNTGDKKVVYSLDNTMGVVVINNAGSTYQMSGDNSVEWDKIKILLATGDVIMDRNFTGIVIAGGDIIVQGATRNVCDAEGVSEAMQIATELTDGSASTVVNLFVDGSYVYNAETTQVGGGEVQTADLVVYENWSKE